MSATEHVGLTLEDLFDMPQGDGWRRELIGGRLHMSPEPRNSHQLVAARILRVISDYADDHGGGIWGPANFDPAVGEHLAPDLVAFGPAWEGEVDDLSVRSAPSLVVEVCSESTRAFDLGGKRDFYERYQVPEYWFVDLDHGSVAVFTLTDGSYGEPAVVGADGTLRPESFPGLQIQVADILKRPWLPGER